MLDLYYLVLSVVFVDNHCSALCSGLAACTRGSEQKRLTSYIDSTYLGLSFFLSTKVYVYM